ncbi:MAG: ABC transporter ATP-binding protein [Chloroflexi bacterium]|nr:ABC transporter ATP-binding protein [Chloroflexota bacterium]
MPTVVEARNLVKKYGDFVAVNGIDFQIREGEAFALLGPNGAGKTSTLRMMGCVSPVSGGSLHVLGQDVMRAPRGVKARLGVVPQRENLDPDLTVRRNLEVYARYFDIPRSLVQTRVREVLDLFHLQDRERSPIASLSEGMKRRLLIARGLINQPSLLILDEPTTGLDPQARLLVWQKLSYLQSQGTTFVLSTHNMDEATQLCNRLIIMHLGKILAEGAPAELVRKHVGKEVTEFRLFPDEKPAFIEKLKQAGLGGASLEVGDNLYLFDAHPETLGSLSHHARQTVHRQATLEDVFLKLTGRSLEE